MINKLICTILNVKYIIKIMVQLDDIKIRRKKSVVFFKFPNM